MDNIDKYLEGLIQNDTVALNNDNSSLPKIKNFIRTRSLRSSIRLNSVIPLELKSGMKINLIKLAVASCIVISFLSIKNVNTNPSLFIEADTVYIDAIKDSVVFTSFSDSVTTNL